MRLGGGESSIRRARAAIWSRTAESSDGRHGGVANTGELLAQRCELERKLIDRGGRDASDTEAAAVSSSRVRVQRVRELVARDGLGTGSVARGRRALRIALVSLSRSPASCSIRAASASSCWWTAGSWTGSAVALISSSRARTSARSSARRSTRWSGAWSSRSEASSRASSSTRGSASGAGAGVRSSRAPASARARSSGVTTPAVSLLSISSRRCASACWAWRSAVSSSTRWAICSIRSAGVIDCASAAISSRTAARLWPSSSSRCGAPASSWAARLCRTS